MKAYRKFLPEDEVLLCYPSLPNKRPLLREIINEALFSPVDGPHHTKAFDDSIASEMPLAFLLREEIEYHIILMNRNLLPR